MSASSSFWNVELLEGSSFEYEVTKGWLNKYDAYKADGTKEVIDRSYHTLTPTLNLTGALPFFCWLSSSRLWL